MTNVKKLALASALLCGLHSGTLQAQTLSSGVYFQGYQFSDALHVEAANLVLLPVAYQLPIGQRLSADVYTAVARGAALISGSEYDISGLVDTRIRASYQATPWALLTIGVNAPTGKASHTNEEARVAAVLSTELLGFREATWGLGAGMTTGVATAHRVGEYGIGLGVSYRMASEFEPVADSALKYTPGNEVRVRMAVDRNIGAAKLTAGVTFQNYSEDQVDGRDLFQPGSRWRSDVTYSFRSSPVSAWTLYLSDVWRAHGDVFQSPSAVNPNGTVRIGSQNLVLAGVVGATRVFNRAVHPSLDFRLQTREDQGGEGWLGGAGVEVPLRWRALQIVPAGKLLAGSVQADTDEGHGFFGGELSLGVRYAHGR